jgi:hypothetical protein
MSFSGGVDLLSSRRRCRHTDTRPAFFSFREIELQLLGLVSVGPRSDELMAVQGANRTTEVADPRDTRMSSKVSVGQFARK